jgi:hypothetical protein
MRIEINLPDDNDFMLKLKALADAENRSRKNWLESKIISIVKTQSKLKK